MVLQGDNAQGKSNLLEAIYLLAVTKSPRATSDSELINWGVSKGSLPVARLAAEVQRAVGNIRVGLALQGKAAYKTEAAPLYVQKRIRINGVLRRSIDLIGLINVVLFSAKDIDLIDGEPSLRRRYIDSINSQLDHRYLRALQRYHKVLRQRNHLLRLIAERRARTYELDFWDRELVQAGSYLIAQRRHTIEELDGMARAIHAQLSGGQEGLEITYRSSVAEDAFGEMLSAARDRELAYRQTLVGPHRDDMRFMVNGKDMGIYGSRGQNRTITLSLKLAEAQFIAARSGDIPIMLLDDVLSELDARRRCYLLQVASGRQHVLITATDLTPFPSDFLSQAAKYRVCAGEIEPLSD
jgi:DNA replication and repair protein RecF